MTIEGRPVPKGRPRAAIIGDHATIYTPGSTAAYEALLGQAAKIKWRQQGRFEPMPGPLKLAVSVVLAKPKGRSAEWPIVGSRINGDLDNYLKIAQDALNGIIFFDDAQIVSLEATKSYGPPALHIEVDRL
jgi:Holliday junction resolvase RusA-like endonuclease